MTAPTITTNVTPVIVVVIEGGLEQGVFSNLDHHHVVTIDWDTAREDPEYAAYILDEVEQLPELPGFNRSGVIDDLVRLIDRSTP